MSSRRVFYTFGNHMHWVDMQWLWGYDVLPGSVADMVDLCRVTGVKGCVNFDAIGYEKLAAESPRAMSRLREAVATGIVEIVGGSYGQPYGHLHGGESNIRQLTFGVEVCQRQFGTAPRTFWEEEFYYFAQLPQLLKLCGYTGASLFFQWTWHTPEIPFEDTPVVSWKGIDRTTIPAVTRNKLNLHQWPEDFDPMLDELAAGDDRPNPLILQWLELMPSPDWMCRSEVLLPRLTELLQDDRFEIIPVTLGEYLRDFGTGATDRTFEPHEIWHGLTLGKNGDRLRRLSRRAESQLISAESLASVVGMFGRPYAQWDVYPTWTLDESWRELLAAQHHDNDECEGLCGRIGIASYERSLALSNVVIDENLELLAKRCDCDPESTILFNPLPWSRRDTVITDHSKTPFVTHEVPAYGWAAFAPNQLQEKQSLWNLLEGFAHAEFRALEASVDIKRGLFRVLLDGESHPIWNNVFPELSMQCNGRRIDYLANSLRIDDDSKDLVVSFEANEMESAEMWFKLVQDTSAIDVSIKIKNLPRPDPGFAGAFRIRWPIKFSGSATLDSPYALERQTAGAQGRRKYPTGDWMTSDQWFEDIEGSFTSLSMINFETTAGGVLVCHDGSMQWFCRDENVETILNAYDPWDEQRWICDSNASFRIVPHRGMSNCEMFKRSMEFLNPVLVAKSIPTGDPMVPNSYGLLRCISDSAVVTSLHRNAKRENNYILRIVEFDGKQAKMTLNFCAAVASAEKTDLLGNTIELISPTANSLEIELRPNEIATIGVDLVEGRKQVRDLDAQRKVWAQVHRKEAR